MPWTAALTCNSFPTVVSDYAVQRCVLAQDETIAGWTPEGRRAVTMKIKIPEIRQSIKLL
jgi:hypothetical protein